MNLNTILTYFNIGIFSLIGCLYISSAEALPSTTYFPGPNIHLTGASNGVYFNTHEVLSSSSTEGAGLHTGPLNFHGGFYIDTLGWALLSTGSFQVHLICSEPITILSSPCSLTGSGWSEMAGEIGFNTVRYYPETATLSGILHTFGGDFPINQIYLPLIPVGFNETLTNLTATESLMLSVRSGSLLYMPGFWGLQDITMTHDGNFIPSTDGNFANVDITLADSYEFRIIDPNGSWTIISNVDITASEPSMDHVGGGNTLIGKYCTSNPGMIGKCPDGAILKATHIDTVGINKIADGTNFYENTVKFRDQYGNPVNQGAFRIYYTGTVSRIQKHPNSLTPYDTLRENDGLIFPGIQLNPDFLGLWRSDLIELNGLSEVRYDIGSLGTTNGTNQIVKFSAIDFELPSGRILSQMRSNSLEIPLTFLPWFTSNTQPKNGNIVINQENPFQTTVQRAIGTRTDIVPDIITLMMIGTGQYAGYRNFGSSPMWDCQSYPQDVSLYTGDCDWKKMNGEDFPSVLKIQGGNSFGFTGTYASFSAYPNQERTQYFTYLHYRAPDFQGIERDILYPIDSNAFNIGAYTNSHIKIIGQNNARSEYGTIVTNGGVRAKFFDTLRKNTSTLSRNRSNYAGVNYRIVQGDITIDRSSFNDLRTIIVLGGNITISENILNGTKHPNAIIALSNSEGNGGNIYIDPSINDIFSSLFAEKSVLTSGDKQLYIYGSIVSANTLGDAHAQICPYHHIGACTLNDAKNYDFEEMRKGYLSLTPADMTLHQSSQPSAIKHHTIPFIVEYDSRILQDPPPGVY